MYFSSADQIRLPIAIDIDQTRPCILGAKATTNAHVHYSTTDLIMSVHIPRVWAQVLHIMAPNTH